MMQHFCKLEFQSMIRFEDNVIPTTVTLQNELNLDFNFYIIYFLLIYPLNKTYAMSQEIRLY